MKLMVIGFPKSGTTSITAALEASGLRAAHWRDDQKRYVGALIYKAVLNRRDPFADLDGYDAVTQADVCLPAFGVNYWPNLDFSVLRAIRRAHPECLFVLNYRRPEAICDSIERWAMLQQRLTIAEIPGLPAGAGKRHHLMAWIENHFDACRSYFATDEQFIELDIESADAADRLGQALGIPLSGWGDFKPPHTPVSGRTTGAEMALEQPSGIGLFAYGTLQQEEVQLATFGRRLEGTPDSLRGYRLEPLVISSAEVARLSGKPVHEIARASGNGDDKISGMLFRVTKEELAASDAYEVDAYARTEVLLDSGARAFVYVGSDF